MSTQNINPKAFGSITIVDVTDVGTFSVTPESNYGAVVIKDNNYKEPKYVPDWSENNKALILSPSGFYAGDSVPQDELAVVWKYKKLGQSDFTPITSTNSADKIYIQGRNLIVATPDILNASVVVFRCEAKYNEPTTNKELNASGEITFNLLTQTSDVRTCSIKGENIFLYKANPEGGHTLTNPELELTVETYPAGMVVNTWEYYKDGGWVSLNGIAGKHIRINGNDNTISDYNDTAIETSVKLEEGIPNLFRLRATASDATYGVTVTDEVEITKLKDGSAGNSLISIGLSNEDQTIPFSLNDNGTESGNYTLANATITIYKGNENVTKDWYITPTASQDAAGNATVTWDQNGYTYQITELTADVGYINFLCKLKEDTSVTLEKKFTVSKVKTGKDGKSPIIYSIESNSASIRKSYTYTPKTDENAKPVLDSEGKQEFTTTVSYEPATITLKAYKQEGLTTSDHKGYWLVVDQNKDRVNPKHTENNTSTTTFTVADIAGIDKINTFYVELYTAGSTEKLIKEFSIPIISDGARGSDGRQGAKGADAVNFILGDISTDIPCYSDGKVRGAFEFDINISGFIGIEKTDFTATIGTLPTGMRLKDTSKDTIKTDTGVATFTIVVDGNNNYLGNVDNGTIQITASWSGEGEDDTTQTKTVDLFHAWKKARQGEPGRNSDIIVLNLPQGHIMEDGEGSVQIVATLLDGATQVPIDGNTKKFVWKQYKVDDENPGYKPIATGTEGITISSDSTTLTVLGSAVHGYASFECSIEYDGNTIKAYQSVEDRNDPLQAIVLCTLGTQILNSQGVGAIYVKVMKNGEEVDPLKSEIFIVQGQDVPAGVSAYYKIIPPTPTDPNSKGSIKYYENGVEAALPTYNYKYQYSFRDKTGKPLEDTEKYMTEGKVIYIDANLIDKKIVADVAISKNITTTT